MKDYSSFFSLLLAMALSTVIIMIGTPSVSATPSCPSQTVSSTYTVIVNSQQELIDSFTGVVYGQSDCVVFSVLSTHPYTIDLTQLLALQVNFVIMSAGLHYVMFECVDRSDMPKPLSGLNYVGFYRLSFHNCESPLWIENVTSVVMEDVRFRLDNAHHAT